MPCTPTNRCHVGRLSCASGSPVCMDTGTNIGNGTECGNNQVCSNGTCVACTPNVSCSPGDPCKTGRTSCETGTSRCVESGNQRNGVGCGAGRVCRDGNCEACAEGMPCTPSNKCHNGRLSCANGSPVCMDVGSNVANGSSCGNNLFCSNGNCVSCTPNSGCNVSDPCKTGRTSCDQGSPRCEVSGNRPDRTACGNGRVCQGGSCVPCGGQNQPCCGGSCNGGRTCSGNRVVEPFCDSGICRVRDAETCGSCQECRDSRCQPKRCGTNERCVNGACECVKSCDGRCIASDACCPIGTTCDGAVEVTCGGDGRLTRRMCPSGDCRSGRCTLCGTKNGLCCINGTQCQDNLNCIVDTCIECGGGQGQECCKRGKPCRGNLICSALNEDTCDVCGGFGEACCGPERTFGNSRGAESTGTCRDGVPCNLFSGQGFLCMP
jgi:hypothetical protein